MKRSSGSTWKRSTWIVASALFLVLAVITARMCLGARRQLALAERYGRDSKLANSQNYTNGIQVTQIAVEAMRRVKAKGKKISRQTLHEELLAMNGYNAYYPLTTVGPVSFSKDDREGVDSLQLYRAENGIFKEVGAPFASEYVKKIK